MVAGNKRGYKPNQELSVRFKRAPKAVAILTIPGRYLGVGSEFGEGRNEGGASRGG